MVESTHLDLQECANDSVSCYSEHVNYPSEFVNYRRLMRSGCRDLFSGIWMEGFENSSSVVSLDVQIVRMGWWLEGDCRCVENAVCVRVVPPVETAAMGYRCECAQGFQGDGFRDGVGCRRGTVGFPLFLFVF